MRRSWRCRCLLSERPFYKNSDGCDQGNRSVDSRLSWLFWFVRNVLACWVAFEQAQPQTEVENSPLHGKGLFANSATVRSENIVVDARPGERVGDRPRSAEVHCPALLNVQVSRKPQGSVKDASLRSSRRSAARHQSRARAACPRSRCGRAGSADPVRRDC